MISILFISVQSLKDNLAKQAMIICGERDRIRGDNVKIAPLQISTRPRNMEQLDRSGHFHYRKDVRIYSAELSDVIPYEQIFEEAERKAKKHAKGCRTEEAKTEHILRYANIVLISGQAGIGKSTLSKLLVEKMLEPNDPLYQAEFVFFIRFRDLDYKQNYDLLEFLTNSASFISSISSEDRTKIIQHLKASGNVCIIMDGLDEADIDLKMSCSNINAASHTTAATFIHHLLSGRLLPRAKKLVTSRPRQLMQLPDDDYSSNLYLNLLGLNDEGRSQICSDLCRDDPVKRDKILSHINSRPDLKSLCYVPIACIMVMMSFYRTDSEKRNLDTLTAILFYALKNWFLKKLKGNFQIKNIANLAYKAFLENRYYFRELHLKRESIDFINTTAFLFNNIKFDLLQGKAKTYFAHLMWQEFFVAIKLRLYSNKEEFQKIVPQLESDKFEMVARFLFGLCNKGTLDELLDCVENKGLNTEADRDECEEILKKFVTEKLQHHRDAASDQDEEVPYYESIVPLMGWLYEMDNDNFTKEAAGWLRDEIEVNGEIFPGDIVSINHILRRRDTRLVLKVFNPKFVGGCSNYFFKELDETLSKHPNLQVSKSLWIKMKSNPFSGPAPG